MFHNHPTKNNASNRECHLAGGILFFRQYVTLDHFFRRWANHQANRASGE